MKIIFFDSKSYDKESFTKELVNYPDIEVKFLKTELTPFTAELAHGYDAVCAFVSADISNDTIEVLNMCGVKLILLRCAGFNNVEMETAKRSVYSVFRAILRKQLLSTQWLWHWQLTVIFTKLM